MVRAAEMRRCEVSARRGGKGTRKRRRPAAHVYAQLSERRAVADFCWDLSAELVFSQAPARRRSMRVWTVRAGEGRKRERRRRGGAR